MIVARKLVRNLTLSVEVQFIHRRSRFWNLAAVRSLNVRMLSVSPVAWFMLSLFLASFSTQHVRAEVFTFKDGRVVSGRIMSLSEQKNGEQMEPVWAVEIQPAIYVKISASELATGAPESISDVEKKYAELVQVMEQTVENHLYIAGWCTGKRLTEWRDAHYKRVLDMDPDNTTARAGLKFTRDDNGRWIKKDEIMGARRGKVFVQGRWRFPESVLIEKAASERQSDSTAATRDIYRWHNEAIRATGNRQAKALDALRQINDPLSVSALADLLRSSSKPGILATPPPMKLLYVQILSRIETFAAASTLSHVSITDDQPQIRTVALDSLHRFGGQFAVPIYLNYLQSKQNAYVNLAAEGIAQLGGEETVLPLINALVTEHERTVGGGNDQIGTGGIAFAGKEEVVTDSIDNPSVAAALNQLTRQSLGYDENAWLAWYASIYAAPADDLRRDL